MEASIASDPEKHPVVRGTGGIRKARWERGARGKSGGVRIIYYYAPRENIVFFFAVYAKSEKEDLSASERKELKKTLDRIKKAVE